MHFPNGCFILVPVQRFWQWLHQVVELVIAECLQVVACIGFLAYFRPQEFGRITVSVFGFSVLALLLYSQVALFKEGLEFLSLRFEEAANVEGTPVKPILIVILI